jgi:K+-sensing histidine kinase KdpD
LLTNCFKFANKEMPIIDIWFLDLWEKIKIVIEDNWKWFKLWEKEMIFEKYYTWTGDSVWLWLGLYLCKKIIDKHNGKIDAGNSKGLWWARFEIILCKKFNFHKV